MNTRTITRGDLPRVALNFLIAALIVGCAGSPRERWDREVLAVGAAADSIRIAVSTGHVKDPAALAAMRFGLVAARNALDKAYPLALAGAEEDAEFWYGQIDDALAQAAAQYAPQGATAHATGNDRAGVSARP